MFPAKGVVKELNPDNKTVFISHEAISNYMAAMTMPFKVKDPKELAGLHRGDEISFRLQVTETESWVDRISKIGTVSLPTTQAPASSPAANRWAAIRPSAVDRQTTRVGTPVWLDIAWSDPPSSRARVVTPAPECAPRHAHLGLPMEAKPGIADPGDVGARDGGDATSATARDGRERRGGC